jgi:hypothetical protein
VEKRGIKMIKGLDSWIKRKGFFFAGLIFLFILSSSAAMAQSQILISPNRYVVLDDPNAGTKAPGFFNPADVRGGNWGSNYWYGESTTIRAVAMVINDPGTPLSGITITFRLKNPAGTLINTTTSATDNKGLAYYLFDLNSRNYWGYWTIEADATVNTENVINITSFALNWWGCAQCHDNKVDSGGMTRTFGSYASKSYYTIGADFHRNPKEGDHSTAMARGACTVCHQSYNGTATNWRFSSDSPNIASRSEYSPDWHKNKIACQGCHKGSNVTNTRAEVTGCYDTAGCHPKKNNNLTGINSTTGYAVGGNYRTIYSFIPANTAKAHNGSTSIPCIVCHDAGHNISKPFNTSSTSNTFTEYQQCIVCHSGLQQHNNNLSCTVCHSQDAHSVKIFAQDATYVTGKTNPNRGNCTNCHQNATFLNLLISGPKAGNYGKPVTQIPNPFNHSTNQYSGSLWNGTQTAFWDNMSQISTCNYCHGAYTLHNSSALGKIGIVKGSNSLNQSLTGGSWCQNCHYKLASDYAGDKLSPQPPEILNLNGLVPAISSDGTGFYNHTGFSTYDDEKCKSCHNNKLAAGVTSLNFIHNVADGSAGGEECIQCHGTDYPGAAPSVLSTFVNITAFNESIHSNINSTPIGALTNDDCWMCHNKEMNRQNVKKCDQCHMKPRQWHGNAEITSNLSELW